ncbi:MAG: hypothetical protein ACUVT7_08175 [Thermoplasmata archaeon]
MGGATNDRTRRDVDPKTRFVMVPIGIALFALGFVMTAASVSGGTIIGQTSHPVSHLVLLSGILVSLAGVVTATVGPASFFFHHRKRSG